MERKLASVLFVDLVASTDLVSGADPEIVRRRVTRFFDSVSHCVTLHGGIVEKFAGDAVMAAFGVPLAHEDDAERAIRAALATLEKVHELGLEARVGVESGEVVADSSESTFATGPAVNLAARLQQEAAAGEILIGPGTARLTEGLFEVTPTGTLELRGFPEPVNAWRVEAACAGGRSLGSLQAPLVGREEELELLETTFSRTVRHGRASLFTIYGDPGVGKSRLAREFVAGVEGATVLSGRCLPYGEGVTYWPIAEMVKASAGISDDDPLDEAQEKLLACCENEAVADLLGLAAGVLEAVEGERAQQEIAWAARAWAEKLAQVQPLVLVFEDIHWSEEPLLDLIEHLAAWVKDAPLLLVCLARSELLDVRPTWGGGRVRATAIELEPLPPEESEELVRALLAERDLPLDVEAILAKSEGNPLFVEETIRMLVEQDGRAGPGRIPDTLQALIAARIDRLPAAQRSALQRASVAGRIFWPAAIAYLSPETAPEDVEHALDDLLLRDLIVREARSSLAGEPAYKFKHVLIREVAYAGLSKSDRAEYHSRYAEWLGERVGEELLEIRAFHLDQAARLMGELEGAPPQELAAAAAGALAKAGKRALSREAFRSARKLLLRAVELEPTLDRRYLAARAAWRLGDFAAVAVEMEEVRAAAAEAGDSKLHGRAWTGLAEVALFQRADAATAGELADHALAVLGPDEPEARFDALVVRGRVDLWLGRQQEAEEIAKEALAMARAAGRKDLEAMVTQALATGYLTALMLEQAEPLVERAIELAEASGSIVGHAHALGSRGLLERLRGHYDEAWATFEAALAIFADLGLTTFEAHVQKALAGIALHTGDTETAERLYREAVRKLKGVGDRAFLCEAQRSLAQLLAGQGRLEEAERLALEARETVGPEDRVSLSTTKLALGVVRAAQGRDAEAEELLRAAVEGLDRWRFFAAELEALAELARFYRGRGRDDEAAAAEERRAELLARSAVQIA